MKKLKLNKKLVLNKETIASLNEKEMNDIKGQWKMPSAGCTDGCGTFRSLWNCTEADCTNDCTITG